MEHPKIPSGNRGKAQGRVEGKGGTSSLPRRAMLWRDSPCLEDKSVHGTREKDLDRVPSVFDLPIL